MGRVPRYCGGVRNWLYSLLEEHRAFTSPDVDSPITVTQQPAEAAAASSVDGSLADGADATSAQHDHYLLHVNVVFIGQDRQIAAGSVLATMNVKCKTAAADTEARFGRIQMDLIKTSVAEESMQFEQIADRLVFAQHYATAVNSWSPSQSVWQSRSSGSKRSFSDMNAASSNGEDWHISTQVSPSRCMPIGEQGGAGAAAARQRRPAGAAGGQG